MNDEKITSLILFIKSVYSIFFLLLIFQSQTDPLSVDVFLDRYSLPRVVRISYKTKFSNETLQSSSSNGSSTSTQSSSGTTGSSSSSGAGVVGSNSNNNNSNSPNGNPNSQSNNNKCNNSSESDLQNSGELFLLYRLIRQRHIFHGHNAKTGVANRKKGVMIPQEFPGNVFVYKILSYNSKM